MDKLSDADAMDELEKWVIDNDPTLDASLPNWVWDLMSLVDDLLMETERS